MDRPLTRPLVLIFTHWFDPTADHVVSELRHRGVTVVRFDARARLASLGYKPDLACGDGEDGYPQAAPFDRLIATCAVTRVPSAWRHQTQPGGLILVNLYRGLGGGALALLSVEAGGQASGRFEPYQGGFMPSKNIARTPAVDLLPSQDRTTGTPARNTEVIAASLRDDSFGMLAALRTDAQQVILLPEDGPEEFWLVSRDGSWACQTIDSDGVPIVRQDGPVRIWDQIESTYAAWNALSQPARHAFGLTITPTGQHLIWHGTPEHQLWRL